MPRTMGRWSAFPGSLRRRYTCRREDDAPQGRLVTQWQVVHHPPPDAHEDQRGGANHREVDWSAKRASACWWLIRNGNCGFLCNLDFRDLRRRDELRLIGPFAAVAG